MKTLWRQLWPVLAFAAAAVAVTYWRGAADGGAGRPPEEGAVTHEVYPWDGEHESRMRYLAWSYSVRQRVGQALLRREVTLWQAAACFRQVEALRPSRMRANSDLHRGATEEERLCRHVIEYVWVALADEGTDDGLTACLEAELDERVCRGDLGLPAPPPEMVGRFDPAGR